MFAVEGINLHLDPVVEIIELLVNSPRIRRKRRKLSLSDTLEAFLDTKEPKDKYLPINKIYEHIVKIDHPFATAVKSAMFILFLITGESNIKKLMENCRDIAQNLTLSQVVESVSKYFRHVYSLNPQDAAIYAMEHIGAHKLATKCESRGCPSTQSLQVPDFFSSKILNYTRGHDETITVIKFLIMTYERGCEAIDLNKEIQFASSEEAFAWLSENVYG